MINAGENLRRKVRTPIICRKQRRIDQSRSASGDGLVNLPPYGRGKTLTGIRLGGQGDVTASHKAWERQGPFADVPTPAARDGRFFLCSDRGDITCMEAATGKTIWSQSLPRGGGKVSASPVLAGSWMYITREDGVTHALELNQKGYDIRANNTIGERVIASPVLCRNTIFLRSVSALYCIKNPNH